MSTSKTEIVIAAVDKATSTLNQIGGKMESMLKPASDLSKAFGRLYQATGVGGVASALGGLAQSAGGAAVAIVGLGGAYSGALGSLLMFANSSANAVDEIGDLASRYQVAARDIQVFGSLVQEAGGTTEDAAVGIGKLKKAMNEALNGGKEQAQAFAGVGISIASLKSMSADQVMLKIADAFKGSENDLAKQAVLLQLMGKNGTVFMDVMNKGSQAYRDRLAEMAADNALFTEEQLAQADDYDKSWSRMMRTLDAVRISVGVRLASAIEPTVKALQQWVSTNRELIDQKLDSFFQALPGLITDAKEMVVGIYNAMVSLGKVLGAISSVLGSTGTAFAVLAVVLSPVILASGQLILAMGKVLFVVGEVTRVIPLLTTSFRFLWALMAANPIGLVVAAVAGLAVAMYKNWDKIVAYVDNAWERIKSAFDVGFFDGMIQIWLEQWQGLANGILGLIKSITPDFLMPEAMKNFEFTFATDRAKGLGSAAAAAQAQKQEIKNTIKLEIDAQGRPKVVDMKNGSDQTTLDVSAGLYMTGA
ncbi:MAG: hypothetical protein ACK4FF_05435 [Limnobacter sp.]|uniref:hypothetical protein n=1 Tax=Limnobacter sp. TaxID=2003368 RepID=UPI00391DDCBD